MLLSPNSDFLVEEVKCTVLSLIEYSQTILPSLNMNVYGWKVREDYNIVLNWFSGNQLQQSVGIKDKKHR